LPHFLTGKNKDKARLRIKKKEINKNRGKRQR